MNKKNHTYRYKMRRAHVQMAYEHGATHAVTFNFNFHGNISLRSARRLIFKWAMMVDRELYPDGKEQTSFIAFLENEQSNLHFHAVLKTRKIEEFTRIASLRWKEIVKSGDLHIHRRKLHEKGLQRWCLYITKDVMNGNNAEEIIFSEAFSPVKATG